MGGLKEGRVSSLRGGGKDEWEGEGRGRETGIEGGSVWVSRLRGWGQDGRGLNQVLDQIL